MQAVIFDWSGTLMDNTQELYKIVSYMFGKLGKKMISLEEFRKEFTTPYMKFYNKYFPNLTLEEQKKLYKEGCASRTPTSCFASVKETLNYLHQRKIKLFILSNDPRARLISEVKNHRFSELFSEIITDTHDKIKPLQELITKHNLNPEETMYVGDTSGDVEAGKVNKTKTVAITWGVQTKEKLKQANPDFLIDDIKELKSIF